VPQNAAAGKITSLAEQGAFSGTQEKEKKKKEGTGNSREVQGSR